MILKKKTECKNVGLGNYTVQLVVDLNTVLKDRLL